MNLSREPVTCVECGTVNPYVNTTCRDCGGSLAEARAKAIDDASDDSAAVHGTRDLPSSRVSNQENGLEKPKRLSALWMVAGVAIYIMIMTFGETFITKQMIEAHPERSQVYNKLQNTIGELPEDEKIRYFEQMKPIIWVGLILFVLAPVLVGGILGYMTGSLRESALGMGISVVLVFLLNSAGQGLGFIGIACIGGILSAGLGTVGALGGRSLRDRLRGKK